MIDRFLYVFWLFIYITAVVTFIIWISVWIVTGFSLYNFATDRINYYRERL